MTRQGLALGLAVSVLLAAALAASQDEDARAARGRQLFLDLGCYGCHTVGKVGTPIAPDLSRIGYRYREVYLRDWLRDPSAQRPTAHMPRITLTEAQLEALAAFLASLR
jgi:cytochrome c oxidase subunit 2